MRGVAYELRLLPEEARSLTLFHCLGIGEEQNQIWGLRQGSWKAGAALSSRSLSKSKHTKCVSKTFKSVDVSNSIYSRNSN